MISDNDDVPPMEGGSSPSPAACAGEQELKDILDLVAELDKPEQNQANGGGDQTEPDGRIRVASG